MPSLTLQRALLAALIGGLIAGTIDIGAACAIFHAPPEPVLKSIAGDLIGRAAAKAGGWDIALLGALLQAFISVVAAGVYCLSATRLTVLTKHWLVYGLLFGAAVNLFMTHIVGPLSYAKMAPFGSYYWCANLAANTVLFGPPIAYFAKNFSRRTDRS